MAGCSNGHVWFQPSCWSCETGAREDDREWEAERRHRERMKQADAHRKAQEKAYRDRPPTSGVRASSVGPGMPYQLPSLASVVNTTAAIAIVFVVGVTYLVGSTLLIAVTPLLGIAAVAVLLARRAGKTLPPRLRPLPASWWAQLAGLGLTVAVFDATRPRYAPMNRPLLDVARLLLVLVAVAGLGWLYLQARAHMASAASGPSAEPESAPHEPAPSPPEPAGDAT